MPKSRISSAAKALGVSTTSVYNHLKRLKGRLREHLTKEDGVSYLDDEGVNVLRDSIAQAQGASHAAIVPQARQDDQRLDSLERAVLAMAGQVGKLVEENRSLRGEVSSLRNQVSGLQIALLPPPPELSRQVKVWRPEPAPDPAASMPWWKVAWLSLVAPEQFRRLDS